MCYKSWFFACILIALGALSSTAQIIIESEPTTDSVNLFVPRKESKMPQIYALGGSILLPGLGHYYMGKPEHAFGYFITEAVSIGAIVFCNQSANGLENDAHGYAQTWAHTSGGPGADKAFWTQVGRYGSSVEYNRIPEYNRDETMKKYTEDNLQWSWDADSLRKEYGKIIERATSYRVVSNVFLAAMVLDRVIAFIDARYAINRGALSALSVKPTLDPISGSAGLSYSTEF